MLYLPKNCLLKYIHQRNNQKLNQKAWQIETQSSCDSNKSFTSINKCFHIWLFILLLDWKCQSYKRNLRFLCFFFFFFSHKYMRKKNHTCQKCLHLTLQFNSDCRWESFNDTNGEKSSLTYPRALKGNYNVKIHSSAKVNAETLVCYSVYRPLKGTKRERGNEDIYSKIFTK